MLPFFDLLGLRVRPYGVLIVAGIMLGLVWFVRQRGKSPALEFDDRWYLALIYAHILGGVLGGKLGYFLVEWRDFSAPPWHILLRDWNVGWVHWFEVVGAFVCGWACLQLYNRTHRPRRYAPYGDYAVTALSAGLWVGRLACFCAGCCYGRAASVPWAVRFTSPASQVDTPWLGVPLHPAQLYESAAVLALCLFLMLYVLPNIQRRRFAAGTAFYAYCTLYPLIRFCLEFFRGDDRGTLLWLPSFLSPSQWVSAVWFAAAAACLWRQGIREPDPGDRAVDV